jgi:hypothetical protein
MVAIQNFVEWVSKVLNNASGLKHTIKQEKAQANLFGKACAVQKSIKDANFGYGAQCNCDRAGKKKHKPTFRKSLC